MAAHSSVFAWRIPWTGEPGGLPSMGSQSRTRLSGIYFYFRDIFGGHNQGRRERKPLLTSSGERSGMFL